MACAQCGSAVAEGVTLCPACDPWATPSSSASRSAKPQARAGLPDRTVAGQQFPAWLRVLVKTNPPAQADLAEAWRKSLLMAWCTVGFYALIVASSIVAIVSGGVGVLLILAVLYGFGFATKRLRRETWLPKAVAVVGTRPDIGYQGLLRIPAVARSGMVNRTAMALTFILVVARVSTLNQRGIPHVVSAGLWFVIFLVNAGATGVTYALHARARRDLDRLLAAPVR